MCLCISPPSRAKVFAACKKASPCSSKSSRAPRVCRQNASRQSSRHYRTPVVNGRRSGFTVPPRKSGTCCCRKDFLYLSASPNFAGGSMAATQPHDKYYLRSLHEDIALLDRKLAHMAKYETFATEKERESATGKLNTKRALLVRNALKLAEEGVEFKT